MRFKSKEDEVQFFLDCANEKNGHNILEWEQYVAQQRRRKGIRRVVGLVFMSALAAIALNQFGFSQLDELSKTVNLIGSAEIVLMGTMLIK